MEEQKSTNKGLEILASAKNYIKEFFDLRKNKENEVLTIESIRNGVVFKGTNLWVLIFAIFIASLGLNVNSTAVIIGAMLISPLMGPIMGFGLSVGVNDFELLKQSFKSYLLTTFISVVTSTLYFSLTPLNEVQSELLARTSPTIYDVLIALFGGEEPFLNKLDSVFIVELETTQADVTGLIGQYAHGNEPSHHVAYLYALAGRPERTQELIRQIFDTQYRPEPDGLCGNDDCGQMSAWYMFSAMGFYPVDPVSGNYVFGAPQLPKVVLNLSNGKTFTVIAEGLSAHNKYVESITLNGEPYTQKHITHEDILKGGTLVFKMKD